MGNATLHADGTGGRATLSYTDVRPPMLLIADDDDAAPFDTAIAEVGGRYLCRIAWADVAATLPLLAGRPLLVVEASGVDPMLLDAVLPLLADRLQQDGGAAVLSLVEQQIDVVARHLLGVHSVLLCDPTPEQRVAALRAIGHHKPLTLQDSQPESVQTEREPFHHGRRESDDERLRRLTDGMARISRYAADFLRPGMLPSSHDLGDRRSTFDPEPVMLGQIVRARDVRQVIHIRQLRGKLFDQFGGEALFEDPAWDMMLDLYAAELEGSQVSVSSLCIAAGVAPTTALRWIAKMTDMELLIRHPDPVDRRRAFMTLSPRARDGMRDYMLALRKMDIRAG